MPQKTWHVEVNGRPHTVQARWSSWTGSGELYVDNALADVWGPSLVGGGVRRFKIDDQDAFLQSTLFSYALYAGGRKIKK
jgi:hypothetical protein